VSSKQKGIIALLKLKRLAFYFVLVFLIFSIFNIFSIINFFVPTEKVSISYAEAPYNVPQIGNFVECDPIHMARNLVCDEEMRNQMGLPECTLVRIAPSPEGGDRPVCYDSDWVMDCMIRATAHYQGSVTEDELLGTSYCGAGNVLIDPANGNYETTDQWIGDTWQNGMREQVILACHECLDACRTGALLATYPGSIDPPGDPGGANFSMCVSQQCRTTPQNSLSIRASDPEREIRGSCTLQEWIDMWQNDPTRVQDDKEFLCKEAFLIPGPNYNQANYDKCMPMSLQDAINFIKDPNNNATTPEENAEAAAENLLQNYENILATQIGSFQAKNSLEALRKKVAGTCIWGDTIGAFCGGTVIEYARDVFSVGQILFGALAMLKIIFGGVLYATAAGNPSQIQSAKEHIKYALIGIVLLLSINIILQIVGVGSENLL